MHDSRITCLAIDSFLETLDPHIPPPATVPATIKGIAGAKTAPATAVATPAVS